MVTEVAIKHPLNLPFDLWNTGGLIFFFIFWGEQSSQGFHSDRLRGLPELLLGSPHNGRGLYGARQKDEGDKRSRCPDVSLVCLGSYVGSPLHSLLSLSFSPSVCFCPTPIRYSAFSLVCWMSVGRCHRAGLLVFIVVFLSSFRSSLCCVSAL